jgi:predicted GH43/DUF377 family glycosyl hydrolase
MAYRVEWSGNDSWAKLAICELDGDWQPIVETNRYLDIPRPHPHSGLAEDPRLIVRQGYLYLTFVSATLSDRGHVACQGVTLLDELRPNFPTIGTNHNFAFDGRDDYRIEKNWILLEDHWLYLIDPLTIYKAGSNELVSKSGSNINWPHGRPSGSTNLVPYGDKLIGMFHSFEHRDDLSHAGGTRRHYVAGWYVVDSVRWRVVAFSKEPFMRAEDGHEDLRPADQQWKPNVIFPCGLIDLGDEFAVSYGWQDSRCRIMFCSKEEVTANLVPVTKHFIERRVLQDPYQGLPGGFQYNHEGRQFSAKSWNRLKMQTDPLGIHVDRLHEQNAARVPIEMTKMAWVEE